MDIKWLLGVGLLAAPLFGCEELRESLAQAAPKSAKFKLENGGAEVLEQDWSALPIPAEDGPQLAPTAMVAPVH